MTTHDTHGLSFRRRCGWCGVPLRAWQVNLCRRCKTRTHDAGIYLKTGGPWCREASRWNDAPDGIDRASGFLVDGEQK